ncbi:hypothetical protein [Pseudomonas psychrophila]|uniref:Uncharacterized protein n=1 Tax=Pseudomonas psychrophila TaxID=122355 RepID=A0A8I1FQK7_9PSED|nr:hypothetical protein [Pseudomonas psychrophila]MBJ2258847.1 hypothetical protein [Pseudomonas psychrophila]
MLAGLATFSVSVLAVGAAFLLPLSKPALLTAANEFKVVGRYCLIKPGEPRPHCDGEGGVPKDPMLSAIKQMNDSLSLGKMDQTPP